MKTVLVSLVSCSISASAFAATFTNRPVMSTYTGVVARGTWIGKAVHERRMVRGNANLVLPACTSLQGQLAAWKSNVVAVCTNFVDINTASNGNYDGWFNSVQFGYAENTNAYQNPTRFKMYAKSELGNQLGVATNFFDSTPWRPGQGEWTNVTAALSRLVHSVPTNGDCSFGGTLERNVTPQACTSESPDPSEFCGRVGLSSTDDPPNHFGHPEYCGLTIHTIDDAMNDFRGKFVNTNYSGSGLGSLGAHIRTFYISANVSAVYACYAAGADCANTITYWFNYARQSSMIQTVKVNFASAQIDCYGRYYHQGQTNSYSTYTYPNPPTVNWTTYAQYGCFTTADHDNTFTPTRTFLGSTYGAEKQFHFISTANGSTSSPAVFAALTPSGMNASPASSDAQEFGHQGPVTYTGDGGILLAKYEWDNWVIPLADAQYQTVLLTRWNVAGGFSYY